MKTQASQAARTYLAQTSGETGPYAPHNLAERIVASGNFGRKAAIQRVAEILAEEASEHGCEAGQPWNEIATLAVAAVKITPAMKAKRAYRLHLVATVKECIRSARRMYTAQNVTPRWHETPSYALRDRRLDRVLKELEYVFNALPESEIDRVLASTNNAHYYFETGCCEADDRDNLSEDERHTQAIFAYSQDLEGVADEMGWGPEAQNEHCERAFTAGNKEAA